MILAAIGLALAAAALHGTWNVLVKLSGDPLITFYRATLLGAAIWTVPTLVGWVFLGRPAIGPAALGFACVSGVLEVTYMWLLSTAYSQGELSVVYPIARGSAPLLAVVIGFGLLGERLSGPQLAGVVVLLGGILAVTLPQTSGRATLPALLTGVAIASYTAIDSVGVRLTEAWLYGWVLLVLMAVGMFASVHIAKHIRPSLSRPASGAPPITWGQGAVIGLIMWAGYLLVLFALSIAPLAVVAPVREVAIVAVAVWGIWKLGERRSAPLKIVGAAATVVGVSLLAI